MLELSKVSTQFKNLWYIALPATGSHLIIGWSNLKISFRINEIAAVVSVNWQLD